MVVVGGGAGGVEVAFALHHRMHADASSHASKLASKSQSASAPTSSSSSHVNNVGGTANGAGDGGPRHRVSIFTRGKILSSHPARARIIIQQLAKERGISIHEGAAVASVSSNTLTTVADEAIAFDECLWCTQAAPARWLKDCELPKGATITAKLIVLPFNGS